MYDTLAFGRATLECMEGIMRSLPCMEAVKVVSGDEVNAQKSSVGAVCGGGNMVK